MAQIRVLAMTASFYTVPGATAAGDPVTMVSVGFGATGLHESRHEVRSVAEAVGIVDRVRDEVRAAHPGVGFVVRTNAVGRKPVGFDASRVALNPSVQPCS